MGLLKRVMARRRDLRLIVTSATMNSSRVILKLIAKINNFLNK